MWALETIRGRFDLSLGFLHAQRTAVLWRMVEGLLTGGMLWGAALGRALPGNALEKHRIKAVDRFLGNGALHSQRLRIHAALAEKLLRRCARPVVLVDITEIRPGVCALTASLAMSGRAMPFFGQVRSKATISKGQSIARFLSTLKAVIPARCAPIIVTDAGFESPWFDRIEALGWDYVGRVRHKTRFLQDGTWVSAQDLHRQATQRARNLGSLRFPRHRPRARRLVLSKARCPKGRVRRNTLGRRGNTSNDKKCAQSAREPWLLATSLACNPTLVVEAYAMRMQIEQNYRDLKNHRWGWHLNLSRSRTNARIEMLLLVSMVATIVVFAIGCAAEKQQLHAAFQANTIKSRRVLSLFTLGVLLLRAQNNLRPHLQHALSELQHKIQSLPIESAT